MVVTEANTFLDIPIVLLKSATHTPMDSQEFWQGYPNDRSHPESRSHHGIPFKSYLPPVFNLNTLTPQRLSIIK
jgi:hypothetical protein